MTVELTEKETQDVQEYLNEVGVKAMPDAAVTQALEAYVSGHLAKPGYRLLEAAGYELFGDGIWSKVPAQMQREPQNGEVNAVAAKEILVLGKKLELYPNDPPEDEQELLVEAKELIEGIKASYDPEEMTPEIAKIVELASKPYYNFEHAPTVPWDGYDGLRITELKVRIESGEVDDKLEFIEMYEEDAARPRKRVLEYVRKRKEELAKEHGQTEKEEEPPREEAPEGEAEEAAPQLPDSGGEEAEERSEGSSERPEDEGGGVDQYDELVKDAEVEVNKLILHVPPEPHSEDLDLPFDLTQLSDKALQKAYGAYNALAYRVNYKLLLEEAKLRRTKLAVKELRGFLFSESVKYDEQNHQRTNADINSEIEQNEELKRWIQRENMLEVNVEAYRSQRDGLYREVDMLSRLETMRHQEAERNGRR